MPVFDLTDDEMQILTRLVRRAIDDDRYPMAPRLDPLKAKSWRNSLERPPLRHPELWTTLASEL